MNFSFKKEEEKFKVGRPKLADTKQKKNALILSATSIMVAICLVFGGLFDLNIINADKLKGSIFGTTITGSKVYKGVVISVPKKVLLGDPDGWEQYNGATIYDWDNFKVTINNTTDKEMTDITYSLSGTGDITGTDGGTANFQSNGFPASLAANTSVEAKFYGSIKDAYDYKDVQEQLTINYKVDGESFSEIYDINFYHVVYGDSYLASLPLVESEESTGEYAYANNPTENFYYKANRSKVVMDKSEDLYDMNVNFSYKTTFSNGVLITAPEGERSSAMSSDDDVKLSDYIKYDSYENGHTYEAKSSTDYETFGDPSHRLWGSVKQTTNGTVSIKLPVYAEYYKKKWTGAYEYQFKTNDASVFTRTKDVTIEFTIYDKSTLEEKLVEAAAKMDKYDDDYYNVDTYNNYINAAKEVYKTRDTTQVKIDEAVKNLETIINNTPEEKKADYTKYNEIISKIISLDSEFYRDNEEYIKLIEEYNNKDNYQNITKKNQSTLDTYVSTLTSIYNNIPGNYTEVNNAINNANKISNEIEVAGVKYNRYTDESYKALTDAVSNVVTGKKVKDQSEIDSYAENINNAIKNLKDHAAYYDKVDEAINAVPKNEIEVSGTKYNRYTDDSYKVLTDLIAKIQDEEKNSPKTVLEQEEVNKYITEIENAISALKDHAAYYTEVDNAIKTAKKKLGDDLINEIEVDGTKYERYTDESYKAVIDAINSVDKNKKVTEQDTVNKYATNINNAVNALEDHAAYYDKVDEAINAVPKNEIEVSGVKYERYTEASYKKVEDLVASVVRDKKVTEQDTVNKYATDINSAVKNLKDHAAYYDKVDEAINAVPKNEIEVSGTKYNRYTDDSYKVLTDLIAKIQDEEKNSPKTVLEQEEVNKYITEIENAISALKDHAAYYTEVDNAIKTAKKKLGDDLINEIEVDGTKYERYTDESYKAVIDAINSVDKNKLVTEQEVVNKYASDINSAVKNLKDHAAYYDKVDEKINSLPKNEIEVNGVKYQKYITASYKELTDLIDSIDRDKTILEQEEVNNYITLISEKEKELELCEADYSKLRNITSLIPYDFSIYNLESVEKLNALLDKIKNLDSDLKITSQDKLDSLVKEIDEVLNSLKLKDTSVITKYDNKYDENYKPDKKVIKKNNKTSRSHIVSITVNGKELDLNGASITVENDVSKADIKVELSNSNDKYEIYGGNALIVGDNTITVYVYNDSDSYEYKFNVKREAEEEISVKKKTKTTINNIIKYKTNSILIISASILGVLIIGTVCYLVIKKKNSEK